MTNNQLKHKVKSLEATVEMLLKHTGLTTDKDPLAFTTVEQCINYACKRYKVNMKDLQSSSRLQYIADARHLSMWLITKNISGMTYSRTARMFGGRDHATASHAVKKINNLIETKQITL